MNYRKSNSMGSTSLSLLESVLNSDRRYNNRLAGSRHNDVILMHQEPVGYAFLRVTNVNTLVQQIVQANPGTRPEDAMELIQSCFFEMGTREGVFGVIDGDAPDQLALAVASLNKAVMIKARAKFGAQQRLHERHQYATLQTQSAIHSNPQANVWSGGHSYSNTRYTGNARASR
jgi:hypothetical protein